MTQSEPKATKQRIDQILADRGLAESRAKAQAYIMAGLVTVAGKKIDKPGHKIASDSAIEGLPRRHQARSCFAIF
jgi:23S rRNA (cytidine1920-2'-O)/16S rRNA (cytidine1409-2'-O)-methyltransferase